MATPGETGLSRSLGRECANKYDTAVTRCSRSARNGVFPISAGFIPLVAAGGQPAVVVLGCLGVLTLAIKAAIAWTAILSDDEKRQVRAERILGLFFGRDSCAICSASAEANGLVDRSVSPRKADRHTIGSELFEAASSGPYCGCGRRRGRTSGLRLIRRLWWGRRRLGGR